MLKCPLCPERRPSRAMLDNHITQQHGETLPTKADRERLDAEWARVGDGLDKAGREMTELRASLDAIDARMAALDKAVDSPDVVRRATLNQVWDKLMDAGNLAGATLVRDMLRGDR